MAARTMATTGFYEPPRGAGRESRPRQCEQRPDERSPHVARRRAMTDRTLERLGAACGIPAVVLSPVGFALISAAGFGGDPTTPREDIARAVARGSGEQVLAGAMVDTLGAVFFVIFAARLWATLRRAEGEPGWLSLACFAGALMAIGASFVDKSAVFALGFKLGHG